MPPLGVEPGPPGFSQARRPPARQRHPRGSRAPASSSSSPIQFSIVRGEGIEPSSTESESAVLPLNEPRSVTAGGGEPPRARGSPGDRRCVTVQPRTPKRSKGRLGFPGRPSIASAYQCLGLFEDLRGSLAGRVPMARDGPTLTRGRHAHFAFGRGSREGGGQHRALSMTDLESVVKCCVTSRISTWTFRCLNPVPLRLGYTPGAAGPSRAAPQALRRGSPARPSFRATPRADIRSAASPRPRCRTASATRPRPKVCARQLFSRQTPVQRRPLRNHSRPAIAEPARTRHGSISRLPGDCAGLRPPGMASPARRQGSSSCRAARSGRWSAS